MNKICPICDEPFKDGQAAVAIMATKVKIIPSDAVFAVEHPNKLIEIVHDECFDYSEYGDEEDR